MVSALGAKKNAKIMSQDIIGCLIIVCNIYLEIYVMPSC